MSTIESYMKRESNKVIHKCLLKCSDICLYLCVCMHGKTSHGKFIFLSPCIWALFVEMS